MNCCSTIVVQYSNGVQPFDSQGLQEIFNLHNILIKQVVVLMRVVADGLGACFVGGGFKSMPLLVSICVS